MRLRKTLPADIEQIIASGDVEAVALAVERCEVGAYLRGSAYGSRLMHFPASEEITDFLLARGEDINSRDRYERTPIHARVWARCLDQIPLLIARGGDINARDTSDQTALFGVVERFPVADVSRMMSWGADPLVTADSRVYGKATLVENVVSWHNFLDTPRALAVIRLLLSVGAPVGEGVSTALRSMDRMRCTFITHGLLETVSQTAFDEASAALSELCALFGVEQRKAKPAPVVGERLELDPSVPARRQHGELWDLLVPDSGQCQTLQGEVIRIAGRGRLRGLRQRRHQLGSFFWGAAGPVSQCRAFGPAAAARLCGSRRGRRRLPEGSLHVPPGSRRHHGAGRGMGTPEAGLS